MTTRPENRDVRLGVVGLGRRAKVFRHLHRPGNGSRVVAVCDLNPERWPVARDLFGPDTLVTDDLARLLDNTVDAVGIFTEDYRHAAPAITALSAHIPAFLEKPMATTVPDCDRVLAAARDHRTTLYVGHNMRHMPVITTMKRLIDAGAIGRVKVIWCRHFVGNGGDYYFKDWHAERRYVNGLLLQKGAHDIDVIQWLAGARTNRVNAMGALTLYDRVESRHDGVGPAYEAKQTDAANWPPLSQRDLSPELDVEDVNHVNLALDNGVLATYQQCHYTPDNWRNYTVIGPAGRLENFGDVTSDAVVKVWNTRTVHTAEADTIVPVPTTGPDLHGGADALMLAEFLSVVRGDGRPRISPVEARDAVATACAATDSVRAGGMAVDVAPAPAGLAGYFAA